jgi:hypothetical protein
MEFGPPFCFAASSWLHGRKRETAEARGNLKSLFPFVKKVSSFPSEEIETARIREG